MLETLTKGFRTARLKLQGKAELTDDNIQSALRDVRVSLLEADVDLQVVRRFLDRVKERSVGEVVQLRAPDAAAMGLPPGLQVTPADHFIKICHDELIGLMGPVDPSLDLTGAPALVMMVGLQGSGKTTTAGKLARRLKAEGRKPLLVAADIYRPAAIDQLMTIGNKIGVPVFTIQGMKPVDLCTLAVKQARNVGRDVVIFDTAGRLAIDNDLMAELEAIKANTRPDNILFVCDAMIGQDAVRTAAEFDRRLGFSGFVLTKLDGDARGGAALSIKEVTGKPVKFLGMGEQLDRLDDFRPEGLADRILGFGDVVGLMKDFEQVIDQKEAETDATRMLQGQFTFQDFYKQIQMVKKMGSLRSIFEKLPGMGEVLGQVPPEALDDRELVKIEAVIQSMTKEERRDPDLLDTSRLRRISKGSGRPFDEVQALYERFLQTRQMMVALGQSGLFGNMGGGGLSNPFGGGGNPFGAGRAARRKGITPSFPGLGTPPAIPGMPALGGPAPAASSPKDKVKEAQDRRARQKALRDARKHQD
jgi:signal recognition particle subunit SRP54